MPKSRNRKDHKKKVEARNQRNKEQKSTMQKSQREFLMNLIQQEKEKGLFEGIDPGKLLNDVSIVEGPSI